MWLDFVPKDSIYENLLETTTEIFCHNKMDTKSTRIVTSFSQGNFVDTRVWAGMYIVSYRDAFVRDLCTAPDSPTGKHCNVNYSFICLESCAPARMQLKETLSRTRLYSAVTISIHVLLRCRTLPRRTSFRLLNKRLPLKFVEIYSCKISWNTSFNTYISNLKKKEKY